MHKAFLTLALEQARHGKGCCAPNPAVGAVIVKNDTIISVGFHHEAGTPHAEIHALEAAGKAATDATLYVTLEPCCHHGRTPPCTDAIRAANIKRVFFAYCDPNPRVKGRGQQILNESGIPCQHISLEAINDFYRSYEHWTLHHIPWITAKLALSLDGKIAGPHGKPITLTGSALQVFTHEKRREADAILTSIQTVLNDNPKLNVRLPEKDSIAKKIYILDSELRFPLDAHLLKTAKSITIFHQPNCEIARIKELESQGIHCHSVPRSMNGLDLVTIAKIIGQEGIHDLWVEAGGRVLHSLITERMAHELYLYIAPQTLGENALSAFTKPLNLLNFYKNIQWENIGEEIVAHCRN